MYILRIKHTITVFPKPIPAPSKPGLDLDWETLHYYINTDSVRAWGMNTHAPGVMVWRGAVGLLVPVNLIDVVLSQLRAERPLLPLLASVGWGAWHLLRLLGALDVLQLEQKRGGQLGAGRDQTVANRAAS